MTTNIVLAARIEAISKVIAVASGEGFFTSEIDRRTTLVKAANGLKALKEFAEKPQQATITNEQIDEAVGVAVHKATMEITKNIVADVRKELKAELVAKPAEKPALKVIKIGDTVYVSDEINRDKHKELRSVGFSKGMKFTVHNLNDNGVLILKHERTGRFCSMKSNLVEKR